MPAKKDVRDVAIIAEAAPSMPHILRSRRLAAESLADLIMLCGFANDLAAEIAQTSNHMHGKFATASGVFATTQKCRATPAMSPTTERSFLDV
ncbi:hypothetical protein ATN79_47310 [Paraburkholderia caribensis]|nr:hypothetical protein ATN79_47310 [Paraburkholderia caribensis]